MFEIFEAAQFRDWYAVAAMVIALTIQASKSHQATHILAKIPKGWRWIVPLAAGCGTVFVSQYAAGVDLSAALRVTAAHGLGVGLTAMGLDAALAESVLPWSGRPQ